MDHNDILRRLRYALSLNDTATIAVFSLSGYQMEGAYLSGLMKKDDESGFMPCRDKIMGHFLDGLIISKRGAKEGHPPTPLKAGEILSNNDILRKIRIAMEYRDDDIIALLKLANFRISKSELSAFFRKPDHRNYKECGDQLLRNLLQGMTKKYRGAKKTKAAVPKQQVKPALPPKTATQPANKSPSPEPSNPVWGEIKKR